MPKPAKNSPSLWLKSFPFPKRDDHKYTRGHLLVTGGNLPMSGAARLATHAAQRLCGMVTIACPEEAMQVYAISCPAAVLQPYADPGELTTILQERSCSAIAAGCGAGRSPATQAMTLALLWSQLPAVLDADALSTFSDHPETLFEAIAMRQAPTVLTPHGGEFRWLFGEMGTDKTKAALGAAKTSGAIILLKGADTIIATPEGETVINDNAPPTLSTAGSGDTLAGMIGALLSARMPAFEATCAAAWLHGAMAQSFGPGLMAEDLAGLIPAALRSLKEI